MISHLRKSSEERVSRILSARKKGNSASRAIIHLGDLLLDLSSDFEKAYEKS